MTRFATVAVLFIFSLPAIAGRGPAVPDYPATQVAPDVYVIHGPITTPNPENQGFMNNPGFLVSNEGIVIVDPGASVQSGEMVLRAVEKISGKPVIAVFNTHVHGDHWLGNQAVKEKYPAVRIYGHPNMIELINQGEGKSWVELMSRLTEGKTEGTAVVGPDIAANNSNEFSFGRHTVRLHHHGKAHTTSDLMIEIVEPGVVFLGDNVLNGRIPRLDAGDIRGNIKACDEIRKTGANVFVPGHGKTGGPQLVDKMKRYLSTIFTSVEELYAQGKSDFEMKAEISRKLTDYSNWISFDEQLGKHISYAYLQVEEENF